MNDFDNLFSSSNAAAKPSSSAADPHRFDDLGDIFGGSAPFTSRRSTTTSTIDLDSMYGGGGGSKHSSLPVFDKPLYDDADGNGNIFDGVPGLKSSASSRFDDGVFSISRDRKKREGDGGAGFDDLLGGLGKREGELGRKGSGYESKVEAGSSNFDDLIPGFGGSTPLERSKSEATRWVEPAASVPKASPKATEDPFSVFESDKHAANSSSGTFTDTSEDISKLGNNRSTRVNDVSAPSKKMQDDLDPFDDLGKSVPTFSSETNNRWKDRGPYKIDSGRNGSQVYAEKEPIEKQAKKSMYVNNDLESHQTLFGMPPVSTGSYKPVGQTFFSPSASATSNGLNVQADIYSGSEEKESTDDVWLTVSEIPLYTQSTIAPPPSRPPPPIPVKRKVNTSSLKSNTSFQSRKSSTWSSVASIDELEEFARGRNRSAGDECANGFSANDGEMNSVAAASAAAMKEAMDRAEAKFRHAREARERDNTWKGDENQERSDREQLQREREEEVREQRKQDKERGEKERERAREIERERARQAVERATREARERAAVEARLKAERAAAAKAAAEARERAEREAVRRAQAEARARAAAGAKERAEKAAAEARERERAAAEAKERERAATEAREKAEVRVRAERAAVERAAAEARARAAAGARERAATAKANQQRNDDDLESFFSMGRASSVPKPRSNSSDPFDAQFQSKHGPEPAKRTASSSANIRKTSSSTNIVDDLSSIFGAASSSGEFQDIEGESEERRRARWERDQRTKERTAKALAEKNERDLQVQREQAERHRIAETLDVEIKRWAAGKEGNLRALLSTLQYVLWPECGWQPVSLTDLITAAAVKKSYRKATLCVHPDKVQQKGANLQQKYIAEKVFDLLKEAWNKFNSEELF